MGGKRRNHYDVTNTVRISHPQDVCNAVCRIVGGIYPDAHLAPVRDGFDTFTRLFAGTLPGYVGCDTWYHDAQHSLDCALAMARLLDGHERTASPERRLGERRVLLGILIALFHDAGYIRRSAEPAKNGAEYTLTHVGRSGGFLADYLPTIGFADQVELTRQLVHFTGYEIALDQIQVAQPLDRMLGFLLGTADVLAQTADRCYLEKCRDFLYREFAICGLAGDRPNALYRSSQDLLEKTTEFNRKLWEERLDGYFEGVYRYMERHFGGRNPYLETINAHMKRIDRLVRTRRLRELRNKPSAIDARALRRILGVRAQVQPLPPKRGRELPRAA